MANKQDKKKGRADGLKRVSFTIEGKRYYAYGHTLKEARERSEEKKVEIKNKQFKRSKDLTFTEYYERWAAAREGTVRGATLRKQSFEAAAVSAVAIDQNGKTFGKLLMSEVEVQHIRILQKALQTKPDGRTRTTNTVNDIMAFVSHVFHDAVIERAVDWNPCKGVKPLKRTEKPARETIHRALTREETRVFLETAAGETSERKSASVYYGLYRFLLATGCRVGEAAALTIADIKADGIQIRRTVTKTADGYYTIGDTTKTETGKRFIPMTPAIRDAISYQRELSAVLFGDQVTRLDDTLFKTSWGNLLMAANVDRDIVRICKQAGIEKFTAHAFRDTFATRALESGMNPKTLQSILGHSDFSTTMNIYAHVMESTKAAEMAAVEVI